MTDPSEDAASSSADERSEVTSGRLLRNTLVNAFANLGSALITAALTPFLLHRLGTEEYGLWVLALSLTFSSGYLALADLGLAEASVKFVAEARATGDNRTIDEIVSSTLAVFTVIGIAAGALIAALVPLFVDLFNVNDALVRTAKIAFLLMGLEVVLELPVAALRSVIAGVQRYTWLRGIDVAGRVLWGILAVIAVLQGHGVVALAALTLLVTALRAVVTLIAAHQVQPGLRIRPSNVNRPTIRRTIGYGGFVGGLQLLSVIYAQMDRVIIGILVSVAAVARYEVAYRIQSLAVLALTIGSSAVLPATAYNAVRGHEDKQRELFLRGSRYAIALSLSVTLAALLYARWLIITWVGPEYVDVTRASRIFLLFPVVACFNQVGVTMLLGVGQARRVLLYQCLAVGTNLVLSIALAPRYGITGVVTGTLIGGLVAWFPYARLLAATFSVNLATWLRQLLVPNLPGVAAQLAFGYVTLRFMAVPTSLVVTLAIFSISTGLHLVAFAGIGMSPGERRHLFDRVRGRVDDPPSPSDTAPASPRTG